MSKILAFEVGLFLLAAAFLYQISYSQIEISEKSPKNQRDQSFIFPHNFTNLKTPLYSRVIFVILDGITYDYVDSRIKEIPFVNKDCDIHIHQIQIFNNILNENPESVVLQRLEIEPPPKTEIKIQTYLKGTNPVVFSMKIPQQNPHNTKMEDSLLYQIGQADNLKETYGFLTYYLYDYIGYWLKFNQFALNPYKQYHEQLKQSEEIKIQEYMNIIKSSKYDTLFIYEGLFDETAHGEGMHTQNGLDAQKHVDMVIREVAKNMDEEALMVVVSDHGKQENGVHFSCRNVENVKVCNSLFFAYTKKGFIKNDKFIESLRRNETDKRISNQAELFLTHESMISSTISNVLNIPISFVNSGRSLFEIYPKSKFENRIQMLQRILQDSFTTLEQQVNLYKHIQGTRQLYSSNLFEDIIDKVNEIELSLYYEQREQIIYSEQKLEEVITQIVNLQNKIQESIYNDTKFYSYQFLVFGIIFGVYVCLTIVYYSFQKLILKNGQYKEYLFILLITAYSCCIYLLNEESSLELYGCQLSVALLIFQSIKVYNDKLQMLSLISFLVLNLLLYCRSWFLNLHQITNLCELIIFIIYFMQIKALQNSNKRVMHYSLFFAVFIIILGILLLYGYSLYCFGLKLLFYIYSAQIQYQYNSNFFQKKFKIQLVLLNLIYHFIVLFFENSLVKEGLSYFPIVLLNVYLLSYVVSLNESIYFSFFTQSHIFITSAILYQVFNLQISYYNEGFSIILIILFYIPLPFIGQMFCKRFKQSKPFDDVEKHQFVQIQTFEEAKQYDKEEIKVTFRYKKLLSIKGGIILISAFCILSSCIGQLWMILNKQVFVTGEFIFNNEYIMISVVSILAANLFIRN
ncbi:hypothetical protein ABPG72_004008 [Tetrahymena utriculariae]